MEDVNEAQVDDFHMSAINWDTTTPDYTSTRVVPAKETRVHVNYATQQSVDIINQRLAVMEPQILWLCQSMEYLTKMLSGVQQAAAMMGGPMGKVAQRLMPKGKN